MIVRSCAAAALLLCVPGRAAEVARAADGAVVVEASGFFKSYGSLLVLPRDLVLATEILDDVVDDTRAQLPPSLALELPAGVALPSQVGLATQIARLDVRATFFQNIDVEAAWQATGVLASSASFGAGSAQAGVLGTSLVAAQRRFVDFEPTLLEGGGLALRHNLDRLLLRWANPHFTLVVGRQALSWGTGRLWNPTDLLSPFAPTDVDREVRRGADAVRLSLPIDDTTQFEVLWLPQQALATQGFVLRLRGNVWDTDLSFTGAKYVDDLVIGADFVGDLGPLGVHGEAAWTLPVVGLARALDGSAGEPLHVHDDFVRAVLGVEGRLVQEVVLGAEVYFNGWGTSDPKQLLEVLKSDRVVRGEVFGAGRTYAGFYGTWLLNDLLSVTTTALVNLDDPGLLYIPALEYWLEQSVLLRAGAFVPVAQGVDVDRFSMLSPRDVLAKTPAFQSVTQTFAARSEYGMSPAGVFFQIGAYVN